MASSTEDLRRMGQAIRLDKLATGYNLFVNWKSDGWSAYRGTERVLTKGDTCLHAGDSLDELEAFLAGIPIGMSLSYDDVATAVDGSE